MNKQVLLMTMVFFLIIITLVVGSIDASTTSDIFVDAVPASVPTTFIGRAIQNFSVVFDYLTIFFRILAFQVTGIPPIFNVLIFYPLTIGTIGLLIDILKPGG